VAANRNPDRVVELLMENEPVYKDLGAERTKRTLPTVKWADMGDNTLMFGLAGGQPRFDEIFNDAGKAWNKRGYISTTVPAAQAKDDSFLRELYKSMPPAAVPEPCGPKPKGQPPATIAALTKKVDVRFATGSDVLDDVAKKTLDDQVKDLAEGYAGAYISVEGNTDDTGNPVTNQSLSQRRAQAVVNYLAKTYNCYPERFVVKGNGSTKPVASNGTEDGRSKNRRTDIGIIPVK
jgi:outer membrane protein OmpA-like peptidoglycan-associated protein